MCIICVLCVYYCRSYCITGVPTLRELQKRKETLLRAHKGPNQIKELIEMKHYLIPLTMPNSKNELLCLDDDGEGGSIYVVADFAPRCIYIPMEDVYGVEGACMTGPMQISWMGQLMNLPKKFVLHADSKFKLHHGEWVLTTLGTHYLRWDVNNRNLSTSFVPLVYLICKQHESVGACTMLMEALNVCTLKYFGGKLEPGAVMSDHCDGFRTAFRTVFPDATFGQCWPHIARKFSEGEYTKKTWEHFEEAKAHLRVIHLAHTPEMRDLLMHEIGDLWDSWGHEMDKFWKSYCVEGWDVWSVGLFNCMLCTPSQQVRKNGGGQYIIHT